MKPDELIHRYLNNAASAEEVLELERLLLDDPELQTQFIEQAEIDANLRQLVQSVPQAGSIPEVAVAPKPAIPPTTLWKWTSAISTLAAIILAMMVFRLPAEKSAYASPTLESLRHSAASSPGSIWSAAQYGDIDEVIQWLDKGTSANAKNDDYGNTPLHAAAMFGQTDIANLLISRGADLGITGTEGNTSLHMAAFFGNTEVVQVLLENGADPGVRNHDGFTARDSVAISWNDGLEEFYRSLEELMDLDLDLKKIQAERPRILKLLSRAQEGFEGTAPSVDVLHAIVSDNIEALRQHIAAGTDLNKPRTIHGSNPLRIAAVFGKPEATKMLIEAGVDLDATNKRNESALHLACFFCNPDVVELLLDAGADRAVRNQEQNTPLELATLELNSELKAIYRHVFGSIGMELDFEELKKARKTIVTMF